jgi:rod shape determining protein RodA
MLETARTYLRYTSWPIIFAMVALMAIGIVAIRASEQVEGFDGYATKQVMFALVSLAAFIGATLVPYHKLGRWAYPLFALTLILLVVVFIPTPLTEPRKGAHRWIGRQALSFQPSELAKLSYIILLAWYLRNRDNYRQLIGMIIPFVLTVVPMALVLKEPDLGTSLLFLPTLYFMLFLAGAKMRHLLVILALGSLLVLAPVPRQVDPQAWAGQKSKFDVSHLGPVSFYQVRFGADHSRLVYTPVAYCRYQIAGGGVYDLQPLSLFKMEPHQIARVEGWLRQDEANIISGKGYQLYQSKMILGSGCFAGRQGWNDSASYFSMLPEDHTDFIFSVIGGQWGMVGCAGVLLLYCVIFVLGIEIAVITDDPFGRLLAVGVLALLFTQLCINIGMAMGLMPVTGMTMPLISYGGSSLLINCIAIGLLVNVGQRRPIMVGPQAFEYSQPREKRGQLD